MELKPITVKATIVPVCATREITIKIPLLKCKCYKGYHTYSMASKYRFNKKRNYSRALEALEERLWSRKDKKNLQ